MSTMLPDAWTSLSQMPLTWVTATIVVYLIAVQVYRKVSYQSVAHPVWTAVAALIAILTLTETSYETYFKCVSSIQFMLGPATVALAIPLYRQLDTLRRNWFAFLAASILGCITAAATAMAASWALGAADTVILSMSVKSVTMPIAISITELKGGSQALTSALVMLTGVLGAALAQPVLSAIKIRNEAAVGFALGTSAHGIGTSRAFRISEKAGAFSGLAMGVSGLITGLVAPHVLKLLG